MGLDVADVRYAARGDGSADLTVWLTAGGETHSLEVSI